MSRGHFHCVANCASAFELIENYVQALKISFVRIQFELYWIKFIVCSSHSFHSDYAIWYVFIFLVLNVKWNILSLLSSTTFYYEWILMFPFWLYQNCNLFTIFFSIITFSLFSPNDNSCFIYFGSIGSNVMHIFRVMIERPDSNLFSSLSR